MLYHLVNFQLDVKLFSDFFTKSKYLQIIRKLYSNSLYFSLLLYGMGIIFPTVREITPLKKRMKA